MKEIINDSNFLNDFISTSISKVEDLVKSNTIIGDPIITPNNTIIIPISKVSLGYVAGGGQINSTEKKMPYPTCGGSGGGASITPIGFIVENNNSIKFIDVENKSAYQTVLNLVNSLISKMNNDKDVKNEKVD